MNRLHPVSAVSGFVVAGILALTTSQDAPPPAAPTPVSIARVEYFARPQDMIQIREGSAYVVPNGKLLVLTALGGTGGNDVELRVDGELILFVGASAPSGTVASLASIRPFSAGSSIEVSCPAIPGDGRVWGYLDQAAPPPANVLRVRYTPHPSQMIEVRQGAPLTVPPGKIFVLTSQGQATHPGAWTQFQVDGQAENIAAYSPGITFASVPLGMSVQSGHVVEAVGVWPTTSDGRAWGYLASQ